MDDRESRMERTLIAVLHAYQNALNGVQSWEFVATKEGERMEAKEKAQNIAVMISQIEWALKDTEKAPMTPADTT